MMAACPPSRDHFDHFAYPTSFIPSLCETEDLAGSLEETAAAQLAAPLPDQRVPGAESESAPDVDKGGSHEESTEPMAPRDPEEPALEAPPAPEESAVEARAREPEES